MNNNPVRYNDPSGHISDDQVRKLVKFKGNDKDWDSWKLSNKNLYNQLVGMDVGDIFRFTVQPEGGALHTINLRLVEYEGGLSFYDLDNQTRFDFPDWFADHAGMVKGAGVLKDQDKHGDRDGVFESSGSYGDVVMDPYHLLPDWNRATDGHGIVETRPRPTLNQWALLIAGSLAILGGAPNSPALVLFGGGDLLQKIYPSKMRVERLKKEQLSDETTKTRTNRNFASPS